MMKGRTAIMSASAVAILALYPAMGFASSDTQAGANVNANAQATGSTTGDTLEKTWENTKESVKETTAEVTGAAKDATNEVKFSLFGPDQNSPATEVSVKAGMTAKGMLDQPVMNSNNERVATVEDIIIDEDGTAQAVVVSDAEKMGLGDKEAAFDYKAVMQSGPEGEAVKPLTEDKLTQAQPFSYDQADAGKDGIRVIPETAYSVEEILDADVIDMRENKIADVDNITFKDGKADKLVIGFDKIMGMGGDKVALDMSDVKLIREGDNDVKFQLSAAQSGQLEFFKQKTSN